MTFIIGILLGAATLIFVFQNMMVVTVRFLFWDFTGYLTVILIVTLFVGMVISWLFSLPELLQVSSLSRRNRRLADELDDKKMKLSETEGKLSQSEKDKRDPIIVEKTVVLETDKKRI